MYDKQPIKTVDDRIEQKISNDTLPKERLKGKGRQKAALTTNGFTPFVKTKKEKNGKTEVEIKAYHAAGPITGNSQRLSMSFLADNPEYDSETIANWVPQLQLAVYDDSLGRPLSASEVDSALSNKMIPHYFVNPMQDLDYLTIEALLRFTIIGPLMDALTKFQVGNGFKPEFEAINPSSDPDKDQQIMEENQDVIDTLIEIDNNLTISSDDYKDIGFIEKISALINVSDSFNRSALMFGYEKPVTVNNKVYKEIPSSLKFAHARDLGIIDAEPGTWRLRKLQWRNAFYMVPARDMIYLWNPLISARTRSSWLYGDSMIMPMIDAARVIRKNIGVNFPAMAEATWAGMFVMAVKPQSQDPSEKEKEYQQIADNMVRGGPNILLEDPQNVAFHNADFNPKVNEFSALTEAMIKYCVANTGLPHAMFYDEASANRATMIGKIQLAKDTVINPMRAVKSRQISDQWYMRWFRLIYKDDTKRKELFERFRIKLTFSDLHIEEWFDKIQAVNSLDGRKLLTDEAYGELIGLDNYASKVDPTAIATPGGVSKNTLTINRTENNI